MNCETCSERLIEYMDGELDREESLEIREHLNGCEKCSKELEEFAEIRRVVTLEDEPEVSSDLLAELSAAAKNSSSKKKKPFWKRWSYSPILVPALSSAIALSVWFYHGGHDIEVGTDTVVASKIEAISPKPEISYQVQGNDKDMLDDLDRARTTLPKKSGMSEDSQTEMPEGEGFTDGSHQENELANEDAKAPKGSSEYAVSEKRRAKVLKKNKAYPGAASKSVSEEENVASGKENIVSMVDEPIIKDNAPAPQAEAKRDAAVSEHQSRLSYETGDSYREQLNVALLQQRRGDCDSSIKNNEHLLNSSPPPAVEIQELVYKSLAECYEQKGMADKAIANYIQLQTVAPDQTALANSRINQIRQNVEIDVQVPSSDGELEEAK